MSPALPATQHNVRQDLQDQVHNQNKPRGGNAMNELTMNNNQKMSLRLPKFSKFSLKELNKNQKGLTLIELLAVIVIIAIIAAIAIPSIGGILKNTRINAHKTNAHMVIDSTRLLITGEGLSITAATPFKLSDLKAKGFLETVPKNPSDKTKTYDPDASFVSVAPDANGNYVYTVTLKKDGAATLHIDAKTEDQIDALTATDVLE